MPGITIDGADVTAITIDGASVTEVTVDGTSVWPGEELVIDATLNSGSATLIVYEDTNQDGVAENSQTYTVLDGNNSYNVDSLTGGSGNDYWFFLEAIPAGETSRIEINTIELTV